VFVKRGIPLYRRLLSGCFPLTFLAPVLVRPPGCTQASPFVWLFIMGIAGAPAAVMLQGAARLIACLALRQEVRSVRLGSGKPPRLRFTVRGVEVSLGLPYAVRVVYVPSSVRRANQVLLAGPTGGLLAAVALLAVSLPRHDGGLLGLGLLMTVTGVQTLTAVLSPGGRLTDMAQLLDPDAGPLPEAAGAGQAQAADPR
jgi:hypothetical protein